MKRIWVAAWLENFKQPLQASDIMNMFESFCFVNYYHLVSFHQINHYYYYTTIRHFAACQATTHPLEVVSNSTLPNSVGEFNCNNGGSLFYSNGMQPMSNKTTCQSNYRWSGSENFECWIGILVNLFRIHSFHAAAINSWLSWFTTNFFKDEFHMISWLILTYLTCEAMEIKNIRSLFNSALHGEGGKYTPFSVF